MSSEDVILQIEGTAVKCKKDVLVSNSDYFKAMFEGNFVEKNKNVIELQDVELKAMNIVLLLLWDATYYIEDEDVLMVLQTSCMLQFDKIRNICLDKIIEILSVKNCLKIWIITEQLDLKPLYLKAKSMALTEFVVIKETDSILELSLQQLCKYLGNVYLKTDNELSVFQTAIKWWYENGKNSEKELLTLLSCIDFKSFLPDHFKEILTYPSISNTELEQILKCLSNIVNKVTTETFSENIINAAAKLNATKGRIIPGFPCILVKPRAIECEKRKKLEYETITNSIVLTDNPDDSSNSDAQIVYLDQHRRKRRYETVHPIWNNSDSCIVYLDYRSGNLETFFSLKENIEGFSLIGYKEYIFMYGGEYTLGRGDWNRSFWAYDTVRDRWQKKSTLPFPRRHFQTCVIGSRIFIVGGTGLYRINQDNLFWYDFKEDTWSKMWSLPVFDRQIKCCDFMDKFLLFSITNRCGYFLGPSGDWITVPVNIDKSLLDGKSEFSIFSYKRKLYIKGTNLIELIMSSNQLHVSSVKEISCKEYNKIETVVCNNFTFTMYYYSERKNGPNQYSLEKYNLDTGELDFVFENVDCLGILQTNEKLLVKEPLHMFLFSHYALMEADCLINDC